MDLRMKSAGGVYQYDIDFTLFGRVETVIDDRGWIGPGFMLHYLRSDPLSPDLQLFYGGSAECVSSHEQDFFPHLSVLVSHFCDRGGFPDPIDAKKQYHPRASRERSRGALFLGANEQIDDLLLETQREIFGVALVAFGRLPPDGFHESLRGFYAHIRRE